MDFDRDLKDWLIKNHVLSPGTLDALHQQFPRTRLEVALLEKAVLDREALLRIKSEVSGCRPIDLQQQPPTAEVVRKIPGAMARKFHVVAVEEKPGTLVVAAADPTDPFAQSWLHMRTQMHIQFLVALYPDVLRVQHDVYEPEELDGTLLMRPALPQVPGRITEHRQAAPRRRVTLPEDGAAPPGKMLGKRYRLDRIAGEGGMGSVWRAFDTTLSDRPVAVKQLRMEGLDPSMREAVIGQFEHEARLLATLDHLGIVPVTDFFTEDGTPPTPYIVMAWVEGRTLREVIDTAEERLDTRRIVDWAREMADVLLYLHGRKPPVIFRDLKPDNVMIDKGGRLRLVDFGLARPVDKRTATALRGLGTSGYAPPEQYGEGTTDTRSDIYSLGATLYDLVSGQRPPASISLLLGDIPLTRPKDVNAECPVWLDDLIVRMMAPRKEERIQSLEEIRQILTEEG